MIELDGNFCEGGGQIIRTALGLSALLKKPFVIKDIRKGRCDPGLKNQHLFCVNTIKELCNAKVKGNTLGSQEIEFVPGDLILKNMKIDIKTAGSITLLMQSLLIPAIFGKKRIKFNIIGGTDVKWSQPYDYFANVLIPHLLRFADINVKLINRGYYPKGGGEIEIIIKPKVDNQNQKLIQVNKGHLMQIKGVSHASNNLRDKLVAERLAKGAQMALNKLCPIEIRTEYRTSQSTGCGICLWAIYSIDNDEISIHSPIRLGADELGEIKTTAEDVGTIAAKKLIKEIDSDAPIDMYLADQILPFMAIIGDSKIKVSKITDHCRSNIYVIEKFLGKKFNIDEENRTIST